MLLHLICHAQSEANAGVSGAGRDCSLTDLGRRQADAAGARLAELGVDRVLASPYVRTLQTAETIRVATGAPAGVLPLLHEHQVRPFEVDDWPLQSRTALGERFPAFALPADFDFSPRWHDAPETEAVVLRRAGRVLDELWQEYCAAGGGRSGWRSSPTARRRASCCWRRCASPRWRASRCSSASTTPASAAWSSARSCAWCSPSTGSTTWRT